MGKFKPLSSIDRSVAMREEKRATRMTYVWKVTTPKLNMSTAVP